MLTIESVGVEVTPHMVVVHADCGGTLRFHAVPRAGACVVAAACTRCDHVVAGPPLAPERAARLGVAP